MRLLKLEIEEPLPGRVLPEMIEIVGENEALRRYRSIVVTTLRQLRGLSETRLRLIISPSDAEEAVRFWLLPRLADHWQSTGNVFSSTGLEIDFGDSEDDFEIHATGQILCPDLGARWVHAALLGLGRTIGRVTGPTNYGTHYLKAELAQTGLPERVLPPLPVIRTDADWHAALESAIGATLRKAWEQEI